MFARLIELIKKAFFYAILPLVILVFVFFMGEQFEVGRLGAVASCEGTTNPATCLRSKGYLPEAPYYPDLGRRYVGGFARLIGGDLGASYQEKLPIPAPAPEKSEEPQAPTPAPVAPPLPLPPLKK